MPKTKFKWHQKSQEGIKNEKSTININFNFCWGGKSCNKILRLKNYSKFTKWVLHINKYILG